MLFRLVSLEEWEEMSWEWEAGRGPYLGESGLAVVLEKSTPTQIRQRILYYY